MRKDVFRKGMVLGIICLFIGASIVPSISGEDSKHVIVQISNFEGPDIEVNNDGGDVDFTFIQDAIDSAKDGDVIWVYSGIYHETLEIINKNIILIGKPYEKDNPDNIKEKPVIDADNADSNNSGAVYIEYSTCTISDFTIKNGVTGIRPSYSPDCIISGNTITDNKYGGIELLGSSNNSISGNTITDNKYGGIYLVGSSNNSISGNTITDNKYGGIELLGSSNNSISGNTINNNHEGILLKGGASNNNISENTIKNNNDFGIYLLVSSNNSISGNTITDNKYGGILLSVSSKTIIKDNIFNLNGIGITGSSLFHYTSHVIENNMANGKPIRYYKNEEGVDVPKNTAQVILANCTNFNIQDLDYLSNTDIGIQLCFSSNITISKNTITDNYYGGISLSYSSNNNISENTIKNNNDFGIYLLVSSNNSISGNTINNNHEGIYLVGSSNNSISGNTITDNKYGGIELLGSSNNSISGNTIKNNNDFGIYLRYSSNNSITGNTITDNKYGGIHLVSSSNNSITGNDIDNNPNGIHLVSSSNNSITGNTITDNKYGGIFLSVSSNNSITGNNIDNNNIGIYLKNSLNNMINKNNIRYNDEFGINSTDTSSGNQIFLNNFFQNGVNAEDYGGNTWYSISDSEGNYWSDYKDKYPGAEDSDGDGFWDDSYQIEPGPNFDYFPFVEPITLLPPERPVISDCDHGKFVKVGEPIIFTFTTEDPVGQKVRYYIDWGDGKHLNSGEFYDSGEEVRQQHPYEKAGSYEVKIKATNEDGRVSEWSEPWTLYVIKNKDLSKSSRCSTVQTFLENHPYMFPLLRQLFGL